MGAIRSYILRALLISHVVLAACEDQKAKRKSVASTQSHAVADSSVEQPGRYSEIPCYRLAPTRDELFAGPVDSIESSHYRGIVWVSVQADTLSKQLRNFQLSSVRLTDKQNGQELRWHRGGTTPVPAELLRMVPELRRRILAARLRVVTSADAKCVMPISWMLPVRLR